jgi:hypothetical protein
LLGELGLEVAELLLVRELAVQEEVRDLLVLGFAAEDVVDRVAAVGELLVLDQADVGFDRDDALEAGDPGGCLLLDVLSIRARAISCLGPLSYLQALTAGRTVPELPLGMTKLSAPHPTHQRRAPVIGPTPFRYPGSLSFALLRKA